MLECGVALEVGVPFALGGGQAVCCSWAFASVGRLQALPFAALIGRFVAVCSLLGWKAGRWLLGPRRCWPFGDWRDWLEWIPRNRRQGSRRLRLRLRDSLHG